MRLRPALIGAGLLATLLFGATWLMGARSSGLAILAAYALGLVVFLAIERARYKPILEAPPGPPWRATAERFIDPETGKRVVVWEHPDSGRRAYVEADG